MKSRSSGEQLPLSGTLGLSCSDIYSSISKKPFVSLNGNLPVTSSINIIPRLQTSPEYEQFSPSILSGLMQVKVPTKVLFFSVSSPVCYFVIPKSVSFTKPFLLINTLSGLISRCICLRFTFKYDSPQRSCQVIFAQTASGIKG